MNGEDRSGLEIARRLMDDYTHRTGLMENNGDESERYLRTDAFAVQTLFGLSYALEEDFYSEKALTLIDLVHEKLGRFHPNDDRKGWISGLPEEEGRNHPTAGGLRIGKKMPERGADEPLNNRLEWERDGQYFHYISRWIKALLQAEKETGDQKFATWAAELIQACKQFISSESGIPKMYWKMSVDLSRPLVPSMGAHDPLEGLICIKTLKETIPEETFELEKLEEDFEIMCSERRNWFTTDPLGIGGLLLNTLRSAESSHSKEELPDSITPKKLFLDSINSLRNFTQTYDPHRPAGQRLAFQECGLSLGLHALYGMKAYLKTPDLHIEGLEKYIPVARGIENFWLDKDNQNATTWINHLNINAVSLAASLVSNAEPFAFSGIANPEAHSYVVE
ncbi:MAG: hypothetical protein WD059_00875 [Balneolaceae bacterium]